MRRDDLEFLAHLIVDLAERADPATDLDPIGVPTALRTLADEWAVSYQGPPEGHEYAALCGRCAALDHPTTSEHSVAVPGGGTRCGCICNMDRVAL